MKKIYLFKPNRENSIHYRFGTLHIGYAIKRTQEYYCRQFKLTNINSETLFRNCVSILQLMAVQQEEFKNHQNVQPC